MTPKTTKSKPLAAIAPTGGRWSLGDLPAQLQVELRDRMAQAKRGEDLQDFDEALAYADRMADEILAAIAHSDAFVVEKPRATTGRGEPVAPVSVHPGGKVPYQMVPARPRTVISRRDGRALHRSTIYLETDLSHSLAAYCAEHNRSMSDVVAAALRRLVDDSR